MLAARLTTPMAVFELHDADGRLSWVTKDQELTQAANAVSPYNGVGESDGEPAVAMGVKLQAVVGGKLDVFVHPTKEQFYGAGH